MNFFHKAEKLYSNPFVAGTGLGLTLLAAFVIMGQGLGASGGYTSIVSSAVDMAAPQYARSNGMYMEYLDNFGHSPLSDWVVFEIFGVVIGGFVSGFLSGRLKFEIVKGDRVSKGSRLILAFCGGMLMGFAAKIARGCTSGLALTGGSLLSTGGWVFMISLFIGAFAMAYLVRRQWT